MHDVVIGRYLVNYGGRDTRPYAAVAQQWRIAVDDVAAQHLAGIGGVRQMRETLQCCGVVVVVVAESAAHLDGALRVRFAVVTVMGRMMATVVVHAGHKHAGIVVDAVDHFVFQGVGDDLVDHGSSRSMHYLT